jgi:hypothetical protein
LVGRQDAQQPHRAVTDDRHRLAGPRLGGHGAEPAGAQHVGGGQQGRDQLRIRPARGGDQVPSANGMRAFRLGADGAHQGGVHAATLVTRPANLAGVVGAEEGPDDEVPVPDIGHLGANLLDDADVLVSHHLVVDGLDAAVLPQVRPADARCSQPDDGVTGFDDPRLVAVLDPDVAGSVHDYTTHRAAPRFKSV